VSRLLILKDPATTIAHHGDYMEVKTPHHSYVVAYRHIKTIYINKAINLSIAECYAISTRVPLYLIDKHGYLLAKVEKVDDESV
jgi:hypothetical protein